MVSRERVEERGVMLAFLAILPNTYTHPYLFSHSLIPNTHPRTGNVANQAGKVCAGIRPGAVAGRGGILNARR